MRLDIFTPFPIAALLASGAVFAEPTADRWRPQLHFTAPDDWINDPNGLFRVGTEWHLQFQYRNQRHWGHAQSMDLLRWEMLPVALAPDAGVKTTFKAAGHNTSPSTRKLLKGALVLLRTV